MTPTTRPRRTPISIAIACAISCHATVTFAQQPDAKPAPKVEGQLEEIVVTAERRAENIKDVPVSISTLGGEKLDIISSGGQDIRMLAARVPSLNIESSFGRAFPRFYIRGYGNTDFDINASQPVSLVFDDVVQENPILKGFPLFDIAQVEVLRGPQGTLFGRNTPAGVIKFDSVKPSRQQDAYVNLSWGKFSTVNLEGAFNLPLADGLNARIAVLSQTRDDWVTNTAPSRRNNELEGYRDTAVRAQLLYEPDKSFSALFNVHSRDLNGSARLFRANIMQPGTSDLVAGFDPEKISIDGLNSQDVKNDGASLRMKWDLGGMLLHSITGYEKVRSFSRGDIDGGFGAVFLPVSGPGVIPFDAESADGLPGHRQITQELRLESTARGGNKWLIGAYYFDETLDIDSVNYSTIGGGVQNGLAKQHQENKATALFGSMNMKVSDALTLRAGLRYTKDEKDFTADRLVAPPFSPTFIGRLTTKTDANNTSWDFSATHALDKNTNVYARVARGFRAPSIQGRLLFGDTVSVANSENVTSYEAGFKADLFNKRARLGVNAFVYDVKDLQLTAVGGNANFNRLLNAKKARGQGVEVDLDAYLTQNLLLTVGASINDTKIKDPDLRTDACGSGCTVLDRITAPINPAIGKFAPTVSIDGNPLPQAPKSVLNATLKYTMPLSSSSEFFVYTDIAYRSKINFFLYEAKEYTGKPLTEVGLRAGYVWGNGRYELAAFGRNIGDQIRAVGGIDFNNLTAFINDPRTFGVQFKAKF
ncbi:MAG: TonB-dependent receptor [Betaproteobacteria bacterium]|nr:TonB-dependent receptor [Betaproteobacteria bacterium]